MYSCDKKEEKLKDYVDKRASQCLAYFFMGTLMEVPFSEQQRIWPNTHSTILAYYRCEHVEPLIM